MSFRIGHGYDVHKLVADRALILGGVTIPYEKGLLGHSDADVLLHAVMDAVLGAMGEPDIGHLFPDKDEAYRGISSMKLAACVAERMQKNGFSVGNIDVTVIAQRPKLAPYLAQMREQLAAAFACEAGAVNIKATTEEGLGFTGAGEGIAAHAVCLLEK